MTLIIVPICWESINFELQWVHWFCCMSVIVLTLIFPHLWKAPNCLYGLRLYLLSFDSDTNLIWMIYLFCHLVYILKWAELNGNMYMYSLWHVSHRSGVNCEQCVSARHSWTIWHWVRSNKVFRVSVSVGVSVGVNLSSKTPTFV
jgi:hypothetical protein